MHPTLFHIGSVTIYSFGLFLALAIIISSGTIAFFTRKARIPLHGLFDNLLFMIFAGVLGARIGYVITYFHYFQPPQGSYLNIFALWQGGLLFYGAVLGGLAAAWFVFRQEQKTLMRWLDITMLGLLIGVVFGQIGCYLGGCAEGVVSTARIAMSGHIPVQLFESAWAAIIFGALAYLYQTRNTFRRPGLVFFLGAVCYLAGRLVVDIWRMSTVHWHNISGLIIVDCVMIVVLFLTLVILGKRKQSGELSDIDVQ